MSGNDITKIQTDTVYFIGKTGTILVCIKAFANLYAVVIQSTRNIYAQPEWNGGTEYRYMVIKIHV